MFFGVILNLKSTSTTLGSAKTSRVLIIETSRKKNSAPKLRRERVAKQWMKSSDFSLIPTNYFTI